MTANALQGERSGVCGGHGRLSLKPVLLDELAASSGNGPNARQILSRATVGETAAATIRLDHTRLTHLRDLGSRHDQGMFERILHSFLEDAPERIITLWHALEIGEAERFFTAAHSLKGISGNLGRHDDDVSLPAPADGGPVGHACRAEPMIRELEEEFRSERELQETYLPCENQP
jgi:hypothetical protein